MRSNPYHAKSLHRIRVLIGWYIALWIFEGALRKWILPQLSAPLAMIRDPLLVVIYLYAWRTRQFKPMWVLLAASLIALCLLFLAFADNPLGLPLLVTFYGLRVDFFHIPLILVIANVWNHRDVLQVGRKLIWVSPVVAILAVAQFALPNSILNTTVGGGAFQQGGAMEHYRASAMFASGAGLVIFSTVVLAFSLHRMFYSRARDLQIGLMGTVACLFIYAVSINRAAVFQAGLTLAVFLFAYMYKQGQIKRLSWTVAGLAALLALLTLLPVFREGVQAFNSRLETAGTADLQGVSTGIVGRAFSSFYAFVNTIPNTPPLGYGIGVGTNAATYLIFGSYGFLAAEDEWSRIILEDGPYLGVAYIILRGLLAAYVGWKAYRAFRDGNILPLVLFSTAVFLLTTGQWGPPEILGGTVLTAGLILASSRREEPRRETVRIQSPLPVEDRAFRPLRWSQTQ